MADTLTGSIALVFPGQGSQFVGMAQELAGASAAAQRIVDEADRVIGFALSELMFTGPAETLEDTINAQPAILTASIAALEAVSERLGEQGKAPLAPTMVAGHSLGEFSALVAAGVLDFPSALALVRERGRLMKEAGTERPGGMAAVLGLDDDALSAVCQEASDTGIVVLANRNCPGQTVISGEVAALERAMELAKEHGAKRVARLGVSIASHSPLMAAAAAQFADLVNRTPMSDPAIPVYANITAAPLTTSADVRAELSRQIECPVNWTGSVRAMIAAGTSTFFELGPGNVLTGLIKRIDREARTLSVADLDIGLPAMTAK
jgi:[acyl-carrier-protein] S-malonyltransferase